jgi:diguanylate cyclase (GGDEF)-like protein
MDEEKQGEGAAMRAPDRLERQPKALIAALSFFVTGLVGWVDFLTGLDYSMAVFYLIPVSIATWFGGKWIGIAISFASAVAWLLAVLAGGRSYAYSDVLYWNDIIELCFFLSVTLILDSLKKSLDRERQTARTDPLTGMANRRSFYEIADCEIKRSQRYGYPFTLSYIDIDNFKEINDTFGHGVGDKLLYQVTEIIRNHIRSTDTAARLGGDEFALLFPETGDQASLSVVRKIQSVLWDVVQTGGMPVTLSIGVVTYLHPPLTVDEMLKTADALMYSVKASGKGRIMHEVVGKEE